LTNPQCFTKLQQTLTAGWSSPVARQAHNLKVVGSNPTPATNYKARNKRSGPCFSRLFAPIADLALFDETWRTF
jgi:hypothetical protein